MTTALILRIEKSEAAARALLAEGFASKAAQGRAREFASRAYSDAKSLINGERSYEVMCDVPYETNNFRPKHAAAIRAAFPALEAEIALIERAVALYAEIKAAPVAPKPEPKKLNDAEQLPMRSDAFNPVLREQFMAQAPALAAEYAEHVRHVAAHYAKQFGGRVPCDLFPGVRRLTDAQKDQQSVVTNLIGRHSNQAGKNTAAGAHWVLDEAKVDAEAERYGRIVALQWFYKTNAKLGELVAATLVEDRGGYVVVAGTKADGAKVSMRQQRVTKWAPVARRMFSQFPSHCYVDGQFHTAHEYAKRFADATVTAD